MKKTNFFSSLTVLLVIFSCVSTDPKYREGEPTTNFNYPKNKEIEKTFYLLGDAGNSSIGSSSKGLIAFKNFLDSVEHTDNYTIFLGDNIYPAGMPKKEDSNREKAEYRIDAQLAAIEDYDGKVVFIPGNHDWYNGRLDGLEREENT